MRSTPSGLRIILWPPQPKYTAALLSRIPRRPLSRRSPFNRTDQYQSWTRSSASVVRLIYLQSLYRAYITMHLKYPGHRRKHNTDGSTGTPINYFLFPFSKLLFLFPLSFATGSAKAGHLMDGIRVQVRKFTQRLLLLRSPFTEERRCRRATRSPN